MDHRIRRFAVEVPQRELQPALHRAVTQLRSRPVPLAALKRALAKARGCKQRFSPWLRALLGGETLPN